ncbi:DUF2161 family putative PD-(D/E)XK-type phosphodiesterase [Acetonema longum]|uniref:Uncharacterized protein n=1 Tax=Acetonema longum DSM 6540 TaxID=1009370 RepID=F7NQ42_9FIRM|nr:DUF2161 family putative PD-(D/E)XK-type phosphodiesterase [Acetonema longum]EGO61801.1 hypothetical protein ALO_21214 [Acetonema longum DSM 6540]
MKEKRTFSLREEDLYPAVRDYLISRNCTVKGEVNQCDVVAVNQAGTVLVVEMKVRVNLEVILQAALRQKVADLVYIAVPKNSKSILTKKWKSICHLLRRLGIGMLLVTFRGKTSAVEEWLEPELCGRESGKKTDSRQRKKLLAEFNRRHGDLNPGGTRRKKLITVYREMAIHIAALLAKHGPLSIKQLKERGADTEKTAGILRDNHYLWFQRIARGVYALSDQGAADLNNYREIADCYVPPQDPV